MTLPNDKHGPTPRTDAVAPHLNLSHQDMRRAAWNLRDLARQLERELAEVTEGFRQAADALLKQEPWSSMGPLCEHHRKGELELPDLWDADDACVACRISYLEAQESLLEQWQQRATKAEDAIKDMERPLDAQMARLNATVASMNGELERLREFQRNVEEAEGRCCPEDYGFEEYISVLARRLSAASATVPKDDLPKAFAFMPRGVLTRLENCRRFPGSASLEREDFAFLHMLLDELTRTSGRADDGGLTP